MRTWPLLLVGAAALVGSSGAIAAPINGSAIAAAAEQIGVGESVHCRYYRHWHPWGWGRGCRGATIYYDSGPRYRYGYRYGHRWGHGGGFEVRTRERFGTTFRGEERTLRGGSARGEFRGGGERGEFRAGRGGGQAGEVSPRGPTGGQFRSGGQAGGAMSGGGAGGGGGRGMGGGQMNSAPTGGCAAPGGGGRGQGGGGEHKQ